MKKKPEGLQNTVIHTIVGNDKALRGNEKKPYQTDHLTWGN